MSIIRARRAADAARHAARGEPAPPVPAPAPSIVDWVDQLNTADRSCCCAARPVVAVVLARPRRLDRPAAVLLCGHHYRASRQVLAELGACVYDRAGQLATGQVWPAA